MRVNEDQLVVDDAQEAMPDRKSLDESDLLELHHYVQLFYRVGRRECAPVLVPLE